jgi:LmbE family N-acetylglucosaminyl deacetylase
VTKPDPTDVAGLLWRFRAKSVLAVAPHPDDVALSVGGLLRLLTASRLVVLTVFSRSRWAPLLVCHDGNINRISRARASEDRRYAMAIAAHRRVGVLPDSSARGVPEIAQMQPPRPDGPLRETIYHLMTAALRDVEPDAVLCPLALGHHVDHVLVRDATLAAARGLEHLALYEDLPYAADFSNGEIADHVRNVVDDARPVTVDIASVYPQKVADVQLYQSQIRPPDLGAVHAHSVEAAGSAAGHAERVWIVVDESGAHRG